MFGFLKMVAWTTTAMATLLLVISVDIRGQDTASNEVREKAKTAERAVADRYEQILRSRPQIGPVLDKLYEFHTRQGSIAELCQRLELSANEGEDGNAYQLLGLLQLRRGLPDDAIANLARAELLLPNEPFASLYRSRALSLNRQFPSALEALQNAARRRPSQSIALEILKELSQFKDRGIDIDVAVALLSELEQQFTGSSQVNEKLADCFIEFGRPEAAQPVYEKLVDLTRDPLRKIELRMQLARLKKRLGQPEQSLIEFERLITQVKPHSWLHTTLIEQIEQLTEELHGSEGLIEYYEGMLQKQPDDVTSALQLARALRLRSRFDEARAWISKAIESSPSQPEPLLAMADLMEETNQFASASESFQRLVRLDPTNVDYIVRWGHLAAQEAIAEAASNSSSIAGRAVQQADAVAIWKRLLVGHELDPAKALQVAELLRSISAEDEAVALYQQAVEVSGGKVEFTELLGEYLLKIDRREEAKKVFDASYAAAGDDRETLIQLSEILRRLKFPAEALRAMEKACESKADFGDLLQLANLQTETEHIEAAINTLTRASRLAESSAELLLAWDTQTKTYKLFRQLPELLNALEKDVTASAGSMESLQQLAMAQSANSQTAEAAATALKATLLKPNSLRAWLLTARLQKEAGLSLRELESLAALCKIDTKHSADYLQRIATIHFQLNQVEQALDSMEKIFVSPSATVQHFQAAASFCLQAKKVEQAVSVLRRATQVFPNDRSAWLILARQLTEMREGASAIEAGWHILELSRDQEQKREAIDLLESLHKTESSMSKLFAGLKQFGIAHEMESETDLLSAWVMLESDSTQGSGDLIANLIDRPVAGPEALRAATELAVRDHNFTQAAAIQSRLLRIETKPANQLKLGQLLWLAGDSRAAGIEWKNVIRCRTNYQLVIEFARTLIDGSNWTMATGLVNVGIETGFKNWEFLAIGIFANVQDKNLYRAADLSEQLLALDLPNATMKERSSGSESDDIAVPLTAVDRLAWIEHAGAWQALLNEVSPTRAGYRTHQSNPRASQAAAVRQLALQRGASLRSNPLTRISVQCFAEARALAVLTKYGKLNRQQAEINNELDNYIADAIQTKDVEKLWDCVLVIEPGSARAVSFTSVGSVEPRAGEVQALGRYREVLEALVALNEHAAAELAINEIVLRRQLQHQIADGFGRAVPAMDANELAKLEALVQIVGADSAKFAGQITLSVELIRAQQFTESEKVLKSTLSSVSDILELANSARQFLSNDRATQQVVSRILLRAFDLELQTNSENNDLSFAISALRSTARAVDSKWKEILPEMIQRQAKQIDQVSKELLFSDSRSNESRMGYRNFRKPVIALPDRSSLISVSLRAALMDSTAEELRGLFASLTTVESTTQNEKALSYFIASVAQALLNEPDKAIALLPKAKEQYFASEIIGLYEVWLLVLNERYELAIDVLKKIEPPNESIQRECELWKMMLGRKLGNAYEAQKAARILAKLPLSVQENADVAAVLRSYSQDY